MMRRRIAGMLLAVALVWPSAGVLAHSGGLDRCGGHHDRKNGGYHVHDWQRYYACHPEQAPKSEGQQQAQGSAGQAAPAQQQTAGQQPEFIGQLRSWLDGKPTTKDLVAVRAELLRELRRLDDQLCDAYRLGVQDPNVPTLVRAGAPGCV